MLSLLRLQYCLCVQCDIELWVSSYMCNFLTILIKCIYNFPRLYLRFWKTWFVIPYLPAVVLFLTLLRWCTVERVTEIEVCCGVNSLLRQSSPVWYFFTVWVVASSSYWHWLWFSLFLIFYSLVCCCHELNLGPVYTVYMLCKLSHVPNTTGFSPGYSFLNLNFDNGCIGYSSHCYDRMPNKGMLWKEGFVLRDWVQFTAAAEWDSWVLLCRGEEALSSECSYLV